MPRPDTQTMPATLPATTPTTTPAVTRTVVVADDTAFVRDRFRQALEGAGHRTFAVTSAADLLTRVGADVEDIDLVVMDLHLPQMHGADLVHALRRIDARRPPLVVFSGTIASATEVRELATLGVAGYVNEYTATQNILPSLAPHLFPGVHNRRSSPRVVLGIPVTYRVGNTIASALTHNVSQSGLAIRTTSPPDHGSTIKVRFRLPGGRKEIDAQARVVWTDRLLGMGVQFAHVEPDDQSALDQFVQSHFFTNRKA